MTEVLIGYFGPSDPDDPDGGDLWRAAELAVRTGQRAGRLQGKALPPGSGLVGQSLEAGVARLAGLVYQDRVWAIIGGIDGPSAHLAEQVVAKARLPLVCAASSDRTANVANVPWMFSVLPGNDVQAQPLAEAVLAREGSRGSRSSRPRIMIPGSSWPSWIGHSSRTSLCPGSATFSRPTILTSAAVVRQVIAENVGAVVVAAGVSDSARLVRVLRSEGFRGASWEPTAWAGAGSPSKQVRPLKVFCSPCSTIPALCRPRSRRNSRRGTM